MLNEIDQTVDGLRISSEPMSPDEYQMYEGEPYCYTLLRAMDSAEERIWIQTFNFGFEHITALLFHKLELAHKRGVDARFCADSYSNFITDGSSRLRFDGYRQLRHTIKTEAFTKLGSALNHNGTKRVSFTNEPSSFLAHLYNLIPPIFGRNHIKMAIIDGDGFIGGVNLTQNGIQKRTDSMVCIKDPGIVHGLSEVFAASETNQLTMNRQYDAMNGSDSLLVDAGNGTSLILERLQRDIEAAQSTVSVVSQFIPDGPIVGSLHQALQRRVNVQVVVPDPASVKGSGVYYMNEFQRRLLQLKRRQVPISYVPLWLHAKIAFIDSDLDNGTIYFGSHNFSEKGVKWHNAEIALRSQNPQFIQNAQELVRKWTHISAENNS